MFMTNEFTGVRLNYKRNFSNSQKSGKKLSKNFYTFTFEIRFHSTILFYILTLTIFLNTKLVVICYIFATIIYFNDSMMDCILETCKSLLAFLKTEKHWHFFFCIMKISSEICITCWLVIDKCIMMHWHKKRKQHSWWPFSILMLLSLWVNY